MPQSEGVHRLKDILVEEVSLVDRAANQRRYLLVKRNGKMDELKPNGRGGFTRITKADDEDEEKKKAEAAKAGKPFPGAAKPFGSPGATGGKPKDDEDDDEEKAKAKKAEDDEEEEKSKAQKADASGAALAGELEDHVEAIQSLIEEMEDMEAEEPGDVHMKKLSAAHKALGGMCEKYMGKRKAEKAGRKMASARLDMFQKAVNTLSSLLAELIDSPAKDKDHAADPGDPTASPAGWSPTNPSMVPSGAGGTAGGWTGGKAIEKRIEDLANVVGKLVKVNKAQTTEIERLKAGGARSNALPIEKNHRPAKDISWPMDMNRPIDRGSVAKSESFFDED